MSELASHSNCDRNSLTAILQPSMFMVSSKEIVASYLTALSNQDFKTARNCLKDDISFRSPLAVCTSASEYFTGNEELRSTYGVEVTYDIKKVFADGSDVCVFFDFSPGSASLFACGWFEAEGDKIKSIRVVFDPRPIFEMSCKK